MSAPKVSIVIPVYNGANYVGQAISSALAQTWENTEIIVVNDGSTDAGETEKAVARFGSRVKYFHKPNGGVSSALNLGIQQMTGDYFSWLSHDDLYAPAKIAHQMADLARTGDSRQLMAAGYYLFDTEDHSLGVMDFHRLYDSERLSRPLFPACRCAVNGCTMLIHRSHFDRVGLFREDLPTTQDYDLWFRMLRGQHVLYGKHIDVFTRVHAAQTSQLLSDVHEAECTRLWLDFFDSLTAEEKCAVSGSEERFWEEQYQHFSQRTSYRQVIAYLRSRCPDGFAPERLPTQPLGLNRLEALKVQFQLHRIVER